MGKWIKDNKGISLVEILISLAILGIIISPLSSLFVNTVKVNREASQTMIAYQAAQRFIEQSKGQSNLELGIKEIVDKDTGFYVVTKIEKYKDVSVNSYDACLKIEEGIIYCYDFNHQFKGYLEPKLNGSSSFEVIIDESEIIVKNLGNGNYLQSVSMDLSENFRNKTINVEITSDGSAKFDFHFDDNNALIDIVSIHLQNFEEKDIKKKGQTQTTYVKDESSQQKITLLYSISVEIFSDEKKTAQLAKLVTITKGE